LTCAVARHQRSGVSCMALATTPGRALPDTRGLASHVWPSPPPLAGRCPTPEVWRPMYGPRHPPWRGVALHCCCGPGQHHKRSGKTAVAQPDATPRELKEVGRVSVRRAHTHQSPTSSTNCRHHRRPPPPAYRSRASARSPAAAPLSFFLSAPSWRRRPLHLSGPSVLRQLL